jgi:DNA-binding IclR family transcriptional regulator
LCRSLIARFRMREAVRPYLRQLASISGETASLHARLGWYAVRIASAPGTAEVTNAPPLGETHPLGEHYAGEAILAFLSDASVARYCAWAAARGVRPPEIGAVRERGFALSESDLDEGASIAFPIRSGAGEAIAALAIEGPVFARNEAQTGDLSGWREIVAHVEALARTQGSLFENPFPHLNPDLLIF